ncbi:MAG: DUF433 domain-containing protein [Chloroflexi bacterium]|nr:DUF433 domain-containing protein [Chloroflexota bacterium]
MRETLGGASYEYYPLGRHVVAAPGICGGRPTFKYTRIEVKLVLDLLAAGWTIERVVADYHRPEVTRAAIREAIGMAGKALVKSASVLQIAA